MSSAAEARPAQLATTPSPRPARPRRRSDLLTYLAAAVTGMVATTWILRLWRADLRVPFFYLGNDSTAVAAHFKTVLETGWYEYQPMLGAPAGQQYHDFPTADNLHQMAARVLGLFTSDFAVAMNVYYLIGFPLAAVTAVYFFRAVGVSRLLTVALSTLYAVAPYHLIRNEGHLWLASYYPVPLALVVVWRVIRGDAIWGSRAVDAGRLERLPAGWRTPVARFAGAVSGRGMWTAFCLALVATASTYYAVFTVLLIAAAGILQLIRSGDRRRFSGAVVAGATAVFVVVLNMLPDLLYGWANGPNSLALSRDGAATEVYAVKISSLLLPAPGHPISALSDFRFAYDETYPLPSESPALGLVGAIGLVTLLGAMVLLLVVPFARRAQTAAAQVRRETMRDLAGLTLVGLLFATVGGLATLISFITPNIRGWNRITILLLLFCLAAVGVLLDGWTSRRAARHPARRSSALPRAVAVIVLVIGVADQSLTLGVPPYEQSAAAFDSDAQFVQAIEDQLPPDAMVFQYPYVEFPESPPVNGVADADQLRMYLHSTDLRWSAGGIRGRPASDWPAVVTSRDPETIVRSLATIGFAGLVTDRTRLGGTAPQVEADFARYTGPAQLVSADGRWAYFSLAGPTGQLHATASTEQLGEIASRLTLPVMGYPVGGFNAIDRPGPASIHPVWTSLQSTSTVGVVNDRASPATVQLQVQLGSRTGAPDVTISVGDWTTVLQLPPPPADPDALKAMRDGQTDPEYVAVDQTVTVPVGRGGLTLSPGPATQAGLDSGELNDMRYTIQNLYFLDPELVS